MAVTPTPSSGTNTSNTNTKVVLIDIEGTTTPLQFVHGVLFPHTLESLASSLAAHWEDPQLSDAVAAMRDQANEDIADGVAGAVAIPGPGDAPDGEILAAVERSVRWQMAADRKSGPLKALQGFLWKFSFESGQIKGQIYDDVVVALEKWKAQGVPVFIYSSGSVEAQKLIFRFSDKGDLLDFISGHFDTAVGPKIEASSYTKIASGLGVNPAHILFLSDNPKEIRAASMAGLQVRIAVREGNHPVSDDDLATFGSVATFDSLH